MRTARKHARPPRSTLASTPVDSSQGGGSPPPARAPTLLRGHAPRPACADAAQHREAAQHDASARASAPTQHCAARCFALCTICSGATCSRHCTFVQRSPRAARAHEPTASARPRRASARDRANACSTLRSILAALPSCAARRRELTFAVLASRRVADDYGGLRRRHFWRLYRAIGR